MPYTSILNDFNCDNFLKVCDTNKISLAESVNINFCKLLLSVNKRAANHTVRGEIGKYMTDTSKHSMSLSKLMKIFL